MKAIEAVIDYTPVNKWTTDSPTRGQVRVSNRSQNLPKSPYVFDVGANYTKWQKFTDIERRLQMMIDFHTMVVRDGIDPQVAHEAFLVIDEYRYLIFPDIKGAEDEPGSRDWSVIYTPEPARPPRP